MHARFEPDLQGRDDRRSARTPMRLEVLGLEINDQMHSAIVRDLSADGMLIETDAAIHLNSIFQISLPNEAQFEGKIVWTSGRFFGCEFSTPMSKAGMSAARLRSAHDRSAPPLPRRSPKRHGSAGTNHQHRPVQQLSLKARAFVIAGLGLVSWLPFVAIGRLALG